MNPQFKEIGEAIVNHIYKCCDEGTASRETLAGIYDENALLTYEDDQRQGKANIMEKVRTLPGGKHAITKVDCQPLPDGGIVAVVLGQIKTDGENIPLGFHHTFVIKPSSTGFLIQNEVFQLGVHNF